MKLGTRSVLFGVHNPLLHGLFVALAWIRLYGWPVNPLYWLAFLVHDIGYLGCQDMDGDAGEAHVYAGAFLMDFIGGQRWYKFALYHSRFFAAQDGQAFSRLCVADKYAFCLTPRWLYLLQARASGEIKEYMGRANKGKYTGTRIDTADAYAWHKSLKEHLLTWVEANKERGA